MNAPNWLWFLDGGLPRHAPQGGPRRPRPSEVPVALLVILAVLYLVGVILAVLYLVGIRVNVG